MMCLPFMPSYILNFISSEKTNISMKDRNKVSVPEDHLRERERERERVCVCVRERERERE